MNRPHGHALTSVAPADPWRRRTHALNSSLQHGHALTSFPPSAPSFPVWKKASTKTYLRCWISATGIFCGDISISAAAKKAYRLAVTVVATVGGKGVIKASRIFCLSRGTLVPYFPLPVTAYRMQVAHSGTDSTDCARMIFFN
ncbi:hypothetical protein AAHE18_07G183900 [Arachis hypogaea]